MPGDFWIKGKVVPFQISGGLSWGGIREFVYDVDGQKFLKRDQVGFGVNR